MIYHVIDWRHASEFFKTARSKKAAIAMAKAHDAEQGNPCTIIQRLKRVRVGMHYEYECTMIEF